MPYLVLGFEFVNEIDATGIGTVVLAAATAGLAFWTRKAVGQGNDELERAHRPVLIALADAKDKGLRPQVLRGTGPTEEPDPSKFLLPLRNIGMGPALHVTAIVEFGDSEGRRSTHGIDTRCGVAEEAISHLAPFAILVVTDAPVNRLTGFTVALDYEDIAGNQWKTAARYATSDDRFHDVKITKRR